MVKRYNREYKMDERFCKDCRWFKKGFLIAVKSAKCTRKESKKVSSKEEQDYLVTGKEKKVEYNYCSTMRLPICECSVEGKLFEPRDKKLRMLFWVEKKLDGQV